MFDFSNKTFLVTGAGGGVGAGLCQYFIDRYANVIALDNRAAVLDSLAEKVNNNKLYPLVADITQFDALKESIDKAISLFRGIDVLVNNAGAAECETLEKSTAQKWQQDIATNLTGAYHCVQSVLPYMLKKKQGNIVNIGTVNGFYALGHPAYSAAKAGMINYTKSLAMEYGRHGIRANIICPGTVKTPIWHERIKKNPEVFDQLKKWYPLGEFAEAEDIAAAVAFLASDYARMITGVVLPVDAGLTAGNRVMASELTVENFD